MGLDFLFFSLNSLFFSPEFFCGRQRKQLRTGCRVIKLRLFKESIDVLDSQLPQKIQKKIERHSISTILSAPSGWDRGIALWRWSVTD
jgi:hypothetical protein